MWHFQKSKYDAFYLKYSPKHLKSQKRKIVKVYGCILFFTNNYVKTAEKIKLKFSFWILINVEKNIELSNFSAEKYGKKFKKDLK